MFCAKFLIVGCGLRFSGFCSLKQGDRVSKAAMLDMSSGDAKLKFNGAAVTDEAGGLEVTRDWG